MGLPPCLSNAEPRHRHPRSRKDRVEYRTEIDASLGITTVAHLRRRGPD